MSVFTRLHSSLPMIPGHCRLHNFTRNGSHTQLFMAGASSHGTSFTARWTGVTLPELSRLLRATPQMIRGSTGIRSPGRRVTCNLQP